MLQKSITALIAVLISGSCVALPADVHYIVRASLYTIKSDAEVSGSGEDALALAIVGRGKVSAKQDLERTLAGIFSAKDFRLSETSPQVVLSPLQTDTKGNRTWPTFCHDLALDDIRYQVCMTPIEAESRRFHLECRLVNSISDKESGYFRALRTIPGYVSHRDIFSVESQADIDWPILLIVTHGGKIYVTAYSWGFAFGGVV